MIITGHKNLHRSRDPCCVDNSQDSEPRLFNLQKVDVVMFNWVCVVHSIAFFELLQIFFCDSFSDILDDQNDQMTINIEVDINLL